MKRTTTVGCLFACLMIAAWQSRRWCLRKRRSPTASGRSRTASTNSGTGRTTGPSRDRTGRKRENPPAAAAGRTATEGQKETARNRAPTTWIMPWGEFERFIKPPAPQIQPDRQVDGDTAAGVGKRPRRCAKDSTAPWDGAGSYGTQAERYWSVLRGEHQRSGAPLPTSRPWASDTTANQCITIPDAVAVCRPRSRCGRSMRSAYFVNAASCSSPCMRAPARMPSHRTFLVARVTQTAAPVRFRQREHGAPRLYEFGGRELVLDRRIVHSRELFHDLKSLASSRSGSCPVEEVDGLDDECPAFPAAAWSSRPLAKLPVRPSVGRNVGGVHHLVMTMAPGI